jgi:hypothetical protein
MREPVGSRHLGRAAGRSRRKDKGRVELIVEYYPGLEPAHVAGGAGRDEPSSGRAPCATLAAAANAYDLPSTVNCTCSSAWPGCRGG